MYVYYCDNFAGHNPVGVSAIVVAEDIHVAKLLLETELAKDGLEQKLEYEQIKLLTRSTRQVKILNNGEY